MESEADIVRWYKRASLLTIFGKWSSCFGSNNLAQKNLFVYMHKLGVVNGDMSSVQRGAIGSLYYFSVTEALKFGVCVLTSVEHDLF